MDDHCHSLLLFAGGGAKPTRGYDGVDTVSLCWQLLAKKRRIGAEAGGTGLNCHLLVLVLNRSPICSNRTKTRTRKGAKVRGE